MFDRHGRDITSTSSSNVVVKNAVRNDSGVRAEEDVPSVGGWGYSRRGGDLPTASCRPEASNGNSLTHQRVCQRVHAKQTPELPRGSMKTRAAESLSRRLPYRFLDESGWLACTAAWNC
jgi:hypothetical protein